MDSNKLLDKINDSIEDAIKPILGKGAAMTPADLESLTKAVCILEKIKTIENGNSYDDSYSENYSYRRGRSAITGRYVSRDAMPYHDDRSYGEYHDNGNSTRRYYDGNSNHNGYSGHSIKDRMIDRLERMIDEAQNDHERQTVNEWIGRLRNN